MFAENGFYILVGLAFLGMILGMVLMASSQYLNPQTHTACVVEDKDRTTTENGSDMRVYTSCGVFSVKDMFFTGDFDSADKYASLDTGKTYTIDTTGYRIPLFSSFPVIREAH